MQVICTKHAQCVQSINPGMINMTQTVHHFSGLHYQQATLNPFKSQSSVLNLTEGMLTWLRLALGVNQPYCPAPDFKVDSYTSWLPRWLHDKTFLLQTGEHDIPKTTYTLDDSQLAW